MSEGAFIWQQAFSYSLANFHKENFSNDFV